MGCSSHNMSLIQNQQLESFPNGERRVYWSNNVSFLEDAIFIRSLILYLSEYAMVRFLGRVSLDGVTWTLVGSDGYIDGQANASLGQTSFQWLGSADERGPFFEIGIEVRGTNSEVASATLSADASFGAIRPETKDLGVMFGTLAAVTVPTQVPGASSVSTYGAKKVRVEIGFDAAAGQPVTFYLATGPASNDLYVDTQTPVATSGSNDTTMSFVVDSPDAFCSLYYIVGTTTSANIMWGSVALLR